MRKVLLIVVGLAVVGAGAWYYRYGTKDTAAAGAGNAPAAGETGGRGGAGGGGRGGGGGGRGGSPTGGRAAMPVETGVVAKHEIIDYITVVGNLIGEATVDIVPRVAGRLETVPVKMGDRVTKGQLVAKMEDHAIREQVNQVEANLEVNKATVVARENDTKVAQSNLERSKASDRQGLISKQNLEDAESRYNSAVSQVTMAKAQAVSTQARLDELKITLNDTNVVSPVNGFVGRRNLDPGAFAGGQTVILSVVDLGTVRMIANLVEKDFRRVQRGAHAIVEVDAFPGENFTGEVSRVAPVFDPATRTATMEIEVPNPGFRLKPGMYARVRLMADRKADALTVPRAAIVDIDSKRGVFVNDENVARFREVKTGLADIDRIEVLDGLAEGTRVVTTGALALRDGDRISPAGAEGRGGRGGGRRQGGGGGGAPEGGAPRGGQPGTGRQ